MILVDDELMSASGLIADAIAALGSTDAMLQGTLKDVLDGLNNNDAVQYAPAEPCSVMSGM
jgi:hypothetical protein